MNVRLTVCALAFVLTACGTVQNGPMQRIHVNSDPEGAVVTAKGCGMVGPDERRVTPTVLFVSRRATGCTVRVAMDDYFPQHVSLTRKHSSRSDGNLAVMDLACAEGCAGVGEALVDGLAFMALAGAGYTIDYATGALYELQPSRLHVTLVPRFAAAEEAEPAEESEEAPPPHRP